MKWTPFTLLTLDLIPRKVLASKSRGFTDEPEITTITSRTCDTCWVLWESNVCFDSGLCAFNEHEIHYAWILKLKCSNIYMCAVCDEMWTNSTTFKHRLGYVMLGKVRLG